MTSSKDRRIADMAVGCAEFPAIGMVATAVMEHAYRWGQAYRAGALVCARVHVAVLRDARIAPEPPMPLGLRVCFAERLDDALRGELERLREARGAPGARLAEGLAPIEIVWDERRGRRRLLGRLAPPRTQRCIPLEETSFPVRQLVGAVNGGGSAEGRARTLGPRAAR